MPLLWWVGVKFIPGGEAFFSSTLNSCVHVLMYTYYLLSAIGPSMQRYLWWKKYMTSLQLLQFWTVMLKTIYALNYPCGFPLEYGYVLIGYMVSHILLFSNFYYKTYTLSACGTDKRNFAQGKEIDGLKTLERTLREENNNKLDCNRRVDSGSNKSYCALICTPESNECGAATYKSIQGAGICTYDDDGASPGPSPPSPGDDCFEFDDKGACEAKATDSCHWCEILGFGICLPIECPIEGRNSTRLVTMAFSLNAKSVDAIVV